MPENNERKLKPAFDAKDMKQGKEAPIVPEAIKKDKPAPALKPKGSWRARADDVDRRVKEKTEAEKAKNDWSKRLDKSLRYGRGFNRSA